MTTLESQMKARGLVLGLAVLTAIAGCGEKKRTEVILGLATDLNAPAPLSAVNLKVLHLPDLGVLQDQDLPISGKTGELYDLPGSFAVYSANGTADRVRIELTGKNGNNSLVTRTAVLTLVPEKTLFVRLGVVSACQTVTDCAVGSTCVDGRCVSEEIDSSRLPEYKPGAEKEIACAGGTTYIDTSTKLALTVTGSACPTGGTCQEGFCLLPPVAAPTPTGAVPIDDFVNQLLSVLCMVEARCVPLSDQALCLALASPAISGGFNDFGAAVAATKSGKSQYDGVAARTCLSEIDRLACANLDFKSFADVSASCQKVFTGTVVSGGRCIADTECVPGSFCAPPSFGVGSGCDGTCTLGGTLCHDDTQCMNGRICDKRTSPSTCVVPIPAGAVNQPCGTNHTCQSGLSCSSTQTCTAPGQSGQSCDSEFSGCANGLTCVYSDDRTSRTCLVPAAKGQPCQQFYQCGAGTVCDEMLHQCVDLPTNGPCIGFECNNSSYCDTSQVTPTCKPRAAIGSPCPGLAPTSECSNGTCQPTSATSSAGVCVALTTCTP